MGATAVPVIDPDTGAITAIDMITVGSGYIAAPTVSFTHRRREDSGTRDGDGLQRRHRGGYGPRAAGAAQFPAAWQGQTLTNSTYTYDILNGRDGGIPDPRNIGPVDGPDRQ